MVNFFKVFGEVIQVVTCLMLILRNVWYSARFLLLIFCVARLERFGCVVPFIVPSGWSLSFLFFDSCVESSSSGYVLESWNMSGSAVRVVVKYNAVLQRWILKDARVHW